MASKRQIMVGNVPVGGGAPVAVQTMTKTETRTTRRRSRRSTAWPRPAPTSSDARCRASRMSRRCANHILPNSPIPIIADIHFNHTLAIKAMEAGVHCIRINPGNIGGPDKVAEVVAKAKEHGCRCVSA